MNDEKFRQRLKKFDEWWKSRIELVERQVEEFREEHSKRRKQMIREHEERLTGAK